MNPLTPKIPSLRSTASDPSLRRLVSLLEWYGDEPLSEWRGTKAQLDEFEARVGSKVPLLFAQLILTYRWETAECEWVTFLANPPGDDLTGLVGEIERDRFFFEVLKSGKLVQLGRPVTGNYDAVCFDTRRMRGRDCPIVCIDHELALQHGKLRIVKEIAPSFRSFVDTILADDPI